MPQFSQNQPRIPRLGGVHSISRVEPNNSIIRALINNRDIAYFIPDNFLI